MVGQRSTLGTQLVNTLRKYFGVGAVVKRTARGSDGTDMYNVLADGDQQPAIEFAAALRYVDPPP